MGLACSSELTTVTVKDLTVGTTVGSTTATTQKKLASIAIVQPRCFQLWDICSALLKSAS